MSEIIDQVQDTATARGDQTPGHRHHADTFLSPDESLPELDGLRLLEVQALHSRVCRQLDREYLECPDGPVTHVLDRWQELGEELDQRERERSGPDPV